jgi:hypothetical protein
MLKFWLRSWPGTLAWANPVAGQHDRRASSVADARDLRQGVAMPRPATVRLSSGAAA